MGKHIKAIDDFSMAIRYNRQFADAFFRRGNTYRAVRNYRDALRNYNQAIRLDPQNADVYYNTACTYSLLNDPDKALFNLKLALEIKQEHSKLAKADLDFNNIRSHAAFLALMAEFTEPKDGQK